MIHCNLSKVLSTILAFFFISLILTGCTISPEREEVDIAQALSSTKGGDCYAKADAPIVISFPRDSGPHEAFQTEWWYYTGNLETRDKRHFGYQLTFFRQALSCEPVRGLSKWRTRQLYFAHFAVTDTLVGKFYSDMRMNRQSIGIAGAEGAPYKIWIDDWRAEEIDEKLVLAAKGDGFKLNLSLTPRKPVVLQGDQGLSRKGKDTFNSSYYYSLPRLQTRGTLEIGAESYIVSGKSWFDHEWSTSALSADVSGWDWFSVHLNDGRDLMICQVRNEKGEANGYGFGCISLRGGEYEILSSDDFVLETQGYWKSPTTGRRYPDEWEIRLPLHALVLKVRPVINIQEHTHMFTYWEGAAVFTGKKGVYGQGYVELTGY